MEELTLKFLTIGDASVGKTCIMLRFAEDNFPKNTMPTIGVEYKIKRITVNEHAVRLQVWDTAGQERYQKTISSTFYRRADGIVLVFDINDRKSFEHVKNWMEQIQQKADTTTAVALVANKADLPHMVDQDEAEALANYYQIPYFIVSAKTGDGVPQVFETLAATCIRRNPPTVVEKEEPIVIKNDSQPTPERPNKCCKI